MNFYITLPSNAADQTTEEAKINNSQTDFTIKLNKPLEFNIPYEVALAEIWYSVNWKVFVTNLKIFYHDVNVDVLLIDLDIELTDAMKLNHVFKKIKNLMGLEIKKIDFEKAIKEINQKRIEQINNLLGPGLEILQIEINSIEKLLSLIKFDDSVKNGSIFLNIFVPDGLRLEMNGYLPTLLTQWISTRPKHMEEIHHFNLKKQNIQNNQDFLSIKGDNQISFKFILSHEQLRVIGELYLYTDIIDYQYVGSQMRKLL